MKNKKSFLGLLLSGFALLSGSAFAEDSSPDKPSVFKMKEVEIKGEIERPDVFYIIPRRKVHMELSSLGKDYSAEIMEPILPARFADMVNAKLSNSTPSSDSQ